MPRQALAISRYDQAEVVATIKQTVAKGASDAQLRMFLEVCRSTGLNPFLKEIWYVPEKGIVMAARDGYLRVANENPAFDGMETRVERNQQNVPVKAVCTVWRKDRNHPVIAEAYYSEYAKQSPVWRQYPSAMISKVAEVLALKRSFAINGVVTEEEIGSDGRGSVEAAQDVARRKIAAGMQPAAVLAESVPEPHDEDRDLEKTLRESIIEAETSKPPRRVAGGRQLMLEAFQSLRARYVAIGEEFAYHVMVSQYSVEAVEDFPDTDEGICAARCCYKEMSLDVADREARR